MNTLTTPPLATLLQRLFAQADAVPSAAFSSIPTDERERLMRSKTDYRALYGQLKELWLPVSPETGQLLYMLARSAQARHVVEFGTSFGISTLFLAAALRDNGGGRVITTEFEPAKVARAQSHVAEAGLADLVEFREGDALETLRDNLPPTIDLLLLDGAKALYNDVLDLVEPHLRPGALIIADNVNYCPDYLARIRSSDGGYLSVPVGPDVELAIRAQ